MICDSIFEEGWVLAEVDLAHISQCQVDAVVCNDAKFLLIFGLSIDVNILYFEVLSLPPVEIIPHPVPEILLSDLIQQLNAALTNGKDLNVPGPYVAIEGLLVHDFMQCGQQPKLLPYFRIQHVDLVLGVDNIFDDFVGLAEGGGQVSFVEGNGGFDNPDSFSKFYELKEIRV